LATAARNCGNLVEGGFSDWYLPTLDDVLLIYPPILAPFQTTPLITQFGLEPRPKPAPMANTTITFTYPMEIQIGRIQPAEVFITVVPAKSQFYENLFLPFLFSDGRNPVGPRR
jgi:hypothetical protein